MTASKSQQAFTELRDPLVFKMMMGHHAWRTQKAHQVDADLCHKARDRCDIAKVLLLQIVNTWDLTDNHADIIAIHSNVHT